MPEGPRGGERWRTLDPPGAIVLAVPARIRAQRAVVARLRELPTGTPVVLEDGRPGAPQRTRRLARRGGIDVERAYVALPSLRRAAYRVEDQPTAMRYFCTSLLTVPPGYGPLTPLLDALARILQMLAVTRLPAAVAPGRVTFGHRA